MRHNPIELTNQNSLQVPGKGIYKMFSAVQNNNYDQCVAEIKSKEDANAYIKGIYILHFAILKKADAKIIEFLLQKGADINASDQFSMTPLITAAGMGVDINLEVVDLLIRYHANVNAKSIHHNTPLIHAAIGKNLTLVKRFIALGAEINAREENGHTALHMACANQSAEIVDFLLSNHAEVNTISKETSHTPLHDAVKNDNLEITKSLIESGAEVNAVTKEKNTPLHFAAENGNEKIIALLIENKAQVNAENQAKLTPLHQAVINNKKEAVEILIRNHADVHALTTTNTTPLHFAATTAEDKTEVAKLLIANGARVNALDTHGCSPLHGAYSLNNKKMLNLLLLHGAKVNPKTSIEAHPLRNLRDESFYEVTELLIKHGIDVNEKSGGISPLHRAARYPNNRKIIELLVKHGAKVNMFCKGMGTPLEVAILEAERRKENDLMIHFQNTNLPAILKTQNYKPIFKKVFKELDEGFLETAKALLDAGAVFDRNLLVELPQETELSNKILLKFLKERLYKANKKNDVAESEKKKIEKEKKIEQQREERKKEREKQKEMTSKTMENAVIPPIEKTFEQQIEERSMGSLIKIKVNPDAKKNYTVGFVCPNHESCKLAKALFSGKVAKLQNSSDGKSFSFTVLNEVKLKELFESPTLKDNLKKVLDTYSKESEENEKDEQFIANWKTHIKKIFPFEVSINQQRQTDGEFLFDVVSVDPMNIEKIKSFTNLISRHFASANEADVTFSENKLNFKSKNKSSLIDKTTEITFKNVSLLRESIDQNKEKSKPATTAQIVKVTEVQKTQENKSGKTEVTNVNVNTNNSVPATLTKEEKDAFALSIKAFINAISSNIFTNKYEFFAIKRITNNRVEFKFDLAKYRSVATETTPIGTTLLFNNMKQAINTIMGKDVLYFDEKEYCLKFVFTNVSKEDVFKKQNEIRQKIGELNIPDGKQEILTATPVKEESETTLTETNNTELFSVDQFMNEVKSALGEIKKNNNKSTYLIQLLKTLNSYSPLNQVVNDTIAFQAYKLLATFTLAVISKEFYQNSDEPHIYNLRSVFRHAYDFYSWDDFHNRFSPFFTKLEEICITLFNSNNNSIFPANDSLKIPVTQLIEELNLFAPLLQEKILKAEPTEDDLTTYKAQIESMQTELKDNANDENCIYFAMLQLCCQIGESKYANQIEKAIYGKLHNPSLVNDPLKFLLTIIQDYLSQFKLGIQNS